MMHIQGDALSNAENRLASMQRVKGSAGAPAGDASSIVKQAQSAGGNVSLKPRRALGDITNKSGKEEATASRDLQKANVRIEVVPAPQQAVASKPRALRDITNRAATAASVSDGRTKLATLKSKRIEEFDMSRDEKVFGGAFGAAPKPFDSGIDIVACKANVLAHGFGLSGAEDHYGSSFGGMRSDFAPESLAEMSGEGESDAVGASMGAADAQLATELLAADLDLLDVGGVSFGGDLVDDIQFDGVEFQI